MQMRSKCIAVLLLVTKLIGRALAQQTPWKPVDLQKLLCNSGGTTPYFDVIYTANEFSTDAKFKPNIVSFMRSERSQLTVQYQVLQTNGGLPIIPTESKTLPELSPRRLDKADSSDIIDKSDKEPEVKVYTLPDGSTFHATEVSDEDTEGIDTLVELSEVASANVSDGTAPRKLSARRRGGGSYSSGGGGFGGSRRRSGGSSWSRPAPAPRPYQVRRRGAPAGASVPKPAPATPPQGYSGPASFSSGTGSNSVNYGYGSKPNYYSGTPNYNPGTGYSGKTSSGYSTGAVVAGVAAGAVAGAGAYYMYSQYRSSFSCGSSWSCCYGCSNSCFGSGGRCNPTRTGSSYQDDILKEAFIPHQYLPVTIRFLSFTSSDTMYSASSICPPAGWNASNTTYVFPATGTFWVTFTAVQEFAGVGGATRNWGTPSFTLIFLVAANFPSLMRRAFM